MIIRVNGQLVDFEAPIYATDDQRAQIKDFFHHHFPNMDFREIKEPEREYDERIAKDFHKWTAQDFLELFSSKTNEEIASGLGSNTSMGVQVKRGAFVMQFLKWKKQHAKAIPITEILIQQFLDEVGR
jgi:hypothetical protein